MIKIEIDGKELEVKPGTSIIEAADSAKDPNIQIPRFCYHKKLSIAANCRMCLVEVVKAPKPLPACATPVTEGMIVKTKSPIALMAQRSVMEFLLINHPLDCPICDQGGECELQDVSMGYGNDLSRFNRGKRSVKDENIGPLIATGMTRCIHCTRCVRFGEEIAGIKELGGVGRGENTEIRSFLNGTVNSELSGNMIDLCPVGALTSKPYRFSARAWELQQRPSVAPHDSIGSNIFVHSLRNNLKRVVPRENEALNEMWLSDRDRFSYEGLKHEDRLHVPMARLKGNILEEISWEQALSLATEYIQVQVQSNPDDLIALVSPSATIEEGYLLQKLIKSLGSDNIDFRLRHAYVPPAPDSKISLSGLEKARNILLIGGSPRKALPMLNHRIRKAALAGAKITTINPVGYDWNYNVNEIVVSPKDLVEEIKKFINQNPDYLIDPENYIIVGQLALTHPDWDSIHALLQNSQHVIICSQGANSNGLYYVNALSKKCFEFDKPEGTGTYLLFNIEPEYDCYKGLNVLRRLNNAQKVICFSPFLNNTMAEYADLVLPLAPFTQTSGTYVNLEGTWQSFAAAIGESTQSTCMARPGWKILSALGQLLNLKQDFDYQSSADVKEAAYELYLANRSNASILNTSYIDSKDHRLTTILNADSSAILVAETNCYAVDNVVRRAVSLQQTYDAKVVEQLAVSPALAAKIDLHDGQEVSVAQIDNLKQTVILTVCIDRKLPEHTVYLSTGVKKTLEISNPYSQVIISKYK